MRIINILYVFLAILIFGACQPEVTIQPEWPAVSSESKPWSRWWWHGSSVTEEGITAELETLFEAGIGGLELTPIYGVIGEEEQFVPYLSEEWVELLEHTLQEADRIGLKIDMATGTGWPFGGPWVSKADASKYLAHKVFKVKGGESLPERVTYLQEPVLRNVSNAVYQEKMGITKRLSIEEVIEPIAANENLQVMALDQVRFEENLLLVSLMAYGSEGTTLDLTEKVRGNGQLDWTAPEGDWTLYAIFEGWHGKMVERAAPGGEGLVIDHFSTSAIDDYLSRFDEAFSGKNIQSLRAFFNDSYEVDDARGQANWTPELLEAFEEKNGYDLRQHLPALFGRDIAENNARVLSDYRATVSDLILETFTKTWAAWAKEQGAIIRNQAHGSPANILDLYAASDIPEAEGTDIIRAKFASSAANVTGKKLASAEAATWLGEHFRSNLVDLKENVDRYLVAGINHVVYHGTCYSPQEDAWPGRLFYAAIHANPRNSLWPGFMPLNQYIARTQSFLQSGIPANDILLYYPMYDRFARPGRELLDHFDGHGPRMDSTKVKHTADWLLEQGYSFDFISDRQIQGLAVVNGAIQSGQAAYKTILLPEMTFMPLETMEKIVELVKAGAAVVVENDFPQTVPGLGDLSNRETAYQALLAEFELATASDGLKTAHLEGGKILIHQDNLVNPLTQSGVKRANFVDLGLNYSVRETETGLAYFLANWSGENIDDWITLPNEAKSVVVFNPMTGEKGLAQSKSNGEDTELYLQIPNGASLILQLSNNKVDLPAYSFFQKGETSIALDEGWQLEFIEGGPALPETINSGDVLGSWTGFEGKTYQSFSGTAKYTISFPKPAVDAEHWLLDLGEVKEIAKVTLNGKEVANLIGPVYQTSIPANLLQENNQLEIEVSNLMANRIIALDKAGVAWRKFYNINFPARLGENRDERGLFSTAGWTPLASGLVGPVVFHPQKK